MTIRAVFFDVGDTLVHRWVHKEERFLWLCAQAGVELPADAELRHAGAVAHERFFLERHRHPASRSRQWYQLLFRAGLEAVGVVENQAQMADRILARAATMPISHWLDPMAIPLLTSLRARGLRLAVVSNWDGTLVDVLRECGLAGYFDAVLDSDVVGKRKPDPTMFQLACACTGVQPNEALHVGDTPDADGAGALAAGVQPLWLDALDIGGEGWPGLPPMPRVRQLSEVETYLNR